MLPSEAPCPPVERRVFPMLQQRNRRSDDAARKFSLAHLTLLDVAATGTRSRRGSRRL